MNTELNPFFCRPDYVRTMSSDYAKLRPALAADVLPEPATIFPALDLIGRSA